MAKQVEGEPYFRMSVDEASDLHDNEEYAFVDVRRLDEYVEGHVQKANDSFFKHCSSDIYFI